MTHSVYTLVEEPGITVYQLARQPSSVPTSICAVPSGGSHAEKPHSLPAVTCLWNPLLDRIRFYERTERLIRRLVPGTQPMLRSEREGNLKG